MEEDLKTKHIKPSCFSKKMLGDITALSKEKITPKNDEMYYHYSIPAFDEFGTYIQESGKDIKSDKNVVKNGQILVSKLNPWFSRVVLPEDIENAIASTEFIVWDVADKYTRNYLYAIAKNKHFIEYCTIKATGTSNSHKRIDPEVMMQYEIWTNEDIIKKFGEKIAPFVSTLEKRNIETHKLTSLKNFLLPLLMNGQVTFKE